MRHLALGYAMTVCAMIFYILCVRAYAIVEKNV